jgi:hypothetical protein
VLGGGGLRVLYGWGADVRATYDDHFHVIRIMLEQKRWPRPDEGWQTYQPPLYHALGALTYRIVSGRTTIPPPPQPTQTEMSSPKGPLCRVPPHSWGRKAVQFLSVAAGVGTLVLIWLTLRALCPQSCFAQATGVALAACLPRLIYMSAMATNDALTWLWVSLCFYLLVRAVLASSLASTDTHCSCENPFSHAPNRLVSQPVARRARLAASFRRYTWWSLAGLASALALWTKAYGLATLAVLAATILPALWRPAPARGIMVRGAALGLAVALALGVWPYVRSHRLTGNPLISNHDLFPQGMGQQLPGERSRISFLSFQLGRLLHHPWVHVDTVDSFWTQLYAELWFDHGTLATLYSYQPWVRRLWEIDPEHRLPGLEFDRRALSWNSADMPQLLLWQGRLLLALGVVPTLLLVCGAFALWRRSEWPVVRVAVAAAAAVGLATPLFQTLRQPFRSSMKATFALHAIAAFIVLFIAGGQWGRQTRMGRWAWWVIVVNLVLLAAVVVWHFFYLAVVFPESPLYYAPRVPL